MKKDIFLPMMGHNIALIEEGLKSTTLRSEFAARKIGLRRGEVGITEWNGKTYEVYCRGPQTLVEAGGLEKIWESEGFEYTNGPAFGVTKHWLNGNGTLWVYEINRVDI